MLGPMESGRSEAAPFTVGCGWPQGCLFAWTVRGGWVERKPSLGSPVQVLGLTDPPAPGPGAKHVSDEPPESSQLSRVLGCCGRDGESLLSCLSF
jgi:hypothetical protein